MRLVTLAAAAISAASAVTATPVQQRDVAPSPIKPSYNTSSCPGYRVAGAPVQGKAGFTVPLTLAGAACNAYGVDVQNLTLAVVYEQPHVLHVHAYDTAQQQYQLPDDTIFERPSSDPNGQNDTLSATAQTSHFVFHHTAENDTASTEPWAFWIMRANASEGDAPLFDTRPASIPTYAAPINASTSTERNSTAMPQHNMVFENQYLQLSSALPRDANLYGLGERYSGGGIGDAGWRLNPDEMLQPFFTLDAGDPLESNMYGYHPTYLEVRNSSDDALQSHVVYHQNTAGLDVLLRPGVIQYRAIGGTLDFRLFSGVDEASKTNAPQTAMEQYVQFVGLPLMVPDWSFGYHQLRWGYKTTQDMRDVRDAMRQADVPLEVQWSDIDYLQSFRDFTVDPERYGDLASYVDELNAAHQHYTPIMDAAIPAAPQNDTDNYVPGVRGRELDVFLKNTNGTTYIGQVWPGYTYFVDEHHPNASMWWNEAYANLSQTIKFSGIWNDMNEPSSFIVGSAGDPNNLNGGNTAHVAATSVQGWPEGYNNQTSGNSGNITVNGTATYTGDNMRYEMQRRALVVDDTVQQLPLLRFARQESSNDTSFHYSPAVHSYDNVTQRFLWDPPYAMHNGLDSSGPLVDNLNKKTVAMDTVSVAGKFYDVHNVDGTRLMMHTHEALQAISPTSRPFIVGRSTYPGAGKYVSHWLGDNYSTWQYLAKNIQGALQFQLFGIPTVGADTCGFNGNTDEELCNRWMMLSAFMPFFRNHNTEGAIGQEPYRWDSVANASRTAIYKRYELLPELYTARARASQKGTPMVKSLWMEFTSAKQFAALRKVDTQYMLGANLLVSPVLEPNATTVTAYFPDANGQWRSVFDYAALNVTADTNATIAAPLSTINVHLRPGRAILTYAQSDAYTIYETRQQPYKLVVNIDNNATATGSAYLDDGTSALPTPSRELTFSLRNGTLNGTSTGEYDEANKIEQVLLLGLNAKPATLTTGDGRDLLANATYDDAKQSLNVTAAAIDVNQAWSIVWTT